MSLKNKLRSLLSFVGRIPSKIGKILLPGGKKTKRASRILVAVYLLILAGVIGAYAMRGPLGEIIINADPLPFSLGSENEEDVDLEEEETAAKDSPLEETPAISHNVDEEDGKDGEAENEENEDEALPVFASANSLLWPVEGKVVVSHGEMFRIENELRAHVGIDIEAPKGEEVVAAWPGTVKETGNSLFLGQYVLLSHGENYLTYYANLDQVTIKEGSTVEAGKVIGNVGASAVIDAGPGEHLHFAIYQVDPESEEETSLDPQELLSMD